MRLLASVQQQIFIDLQTSAYGAFFSALLAALYAATGSIWRMKFSQVALSM